MNILERIAATKRMEVAAMQQVTPTELVRSLAMESARPTLSMRDSIARRRVAIIAEHKRRSPSKGDIAPMSSVEATARAYHLGGAAAMSVLTDTPYFGGSLTDLAVARRAAPELPILRKEFIVSEFQIYQARSFGADAILLIAAMLNLEEMMRFNDLAHSLGMQTLVEIHNAAELAKVPSDSDMVGVNNRDLTSFATDIANSARLIESLPADTIKIAESGIHSPADVRRLRSLGFDGFLIGEALMSTPEPGRTLAAFIEQSL